VAIEQTHYTNTLSTNGGSRSTLVYVCNDSEWMATRNGLANALDANDPTLKCTEVTREHLNNDPATGKSVLTASFTPKDKAQQRQPDQPMMPRIQFGSEMFSVRGKGWVWATGNKPIDNDRVQPVKVIQTAELILYGTRTSMDLSTYDAYNDCINADVFLGAAAGTVRFDSPSAQARIQGDGSVVWDVELKFKRRSIHWNKYWNEDTNAWDDIKCGGIHTYEFAVFAPLLT